jgi:HK97 family phage prohead protease
MPNLGRAYSFIEIKSFEDDARILRGIASTPTPDRMLDTVNPLGASFELPIPFLWQHQHDAPVGHVIEAKPNKNNIPFVAQLAKTDEPGTLKDQLDKAWQSLKLKLVRAVSIGFNPTKWSFLENGGIDFEEWDWYELSAVTIPANPEAVITAVKQFDRIYREAEGIPDFVPPLPEIPSPPEPAAIGKSCPVVRLNDPPASRQPFIINSIKRIPR